MTYKITGLSKRYGELVVLDRFGCDFPSKGVTVLLGPSGCGKTTLLKMIAGLVAPDCGDLGYLRDLTPALIFQEPRLLPWRTVEENLGLVMPSYPSQHAARRISRLLALVGISQFRDYRPGTLSGGMRQRVALARGFCVEADILLLDEPLQGLDLRLKRELIDVLSRLRNEVPLTTVMVTHTVEEALLLADRILVLSARPMQVIAAIDNPVPQSERRLGTAGLTELEAELYRLLLD